MKLPGSSRLRWGIAAGALGAWFFSRRGRKPAKVGGGVPKPIRRVGRQTFRGNR